MDQKIGPDQQNSHVGSEVLLEIISQKFFSNKDLAPTISDKLLKVVNTLFLNDMEKCKS